MEIIECPHCHVRVLPTKDNICPACRENVLDVADVNPNMVSMIVREGTQLPTFCSSCNSYTERYVRLQGDQESEIANAILTLAELLALHPKWSHRNSEVGTSNVYIYLPQCEQCAELGKPEPLEVDYEHQTMKFMVHRSFRDRAYPPKPETGSSEANDPTSES